MVFLFQEHLLEKQQKSECNEVKLFVDPNQLSFVTVILTRINKEKF